MGSPYLMGLVCGVLVGLSVLLLARRTACTGSYCGPRRKVAVLCALAAILPGLALGLSSRHRPAPSSAPPARVPAAVTPSR